MTIAQLKKAERQTVYAEMGEIMEYFCRSARASRLPNGEFIGERPDNLSSLLYLLEPIQEDHGLVPAMFAGLFCFSKAETEKQVKRAVKFLSPLRKSPTEICTETYRTLKRRFDEIANATLVDRLAEFKIPAFLDLARLADVPLGPFLSQHTDINEKWTIDEVTDRMRSLVDGGEFPDILRQALEEARWGTWTTALRRLSSVALPAL
jgi:hypothetical protein